MDGVKVTVRGNIRNKPPLSGPRALQRLMAQIILARRQNEQQTARCEMKATQLNHLVPSSSLSPTLCDAGSPLPRSPSGCVSRGTLACKSRRFETAAANLNRFSGWQPPLDLRLTGAKTNEFPRSPLRAVAIIEPSHQTGQ